MRSISKERELVKAIAAGGSSRAEPKEISGGFPVILRSSPRLAVERIALAQVKRERRAKLIISRRDKQTNTPKIIGE